MTMNATQSKFLKIYDGAKQIRKGNKINPFQMSDKEEINILKNLQILFDTTEKLKSPVQIRKENNEITDFETIKSVFNMMNGELSGREIHIPISFFLSSKILDGSCDELIQFAKSKQIHFEKEKKLNHIYLIGFKPIKGGKKIAISIIRKIRDMVKANRTRKDSKFELIFELKYRENNFTQKDIPHYLIFSKSWIDETSKRSDNILIKLFDIFDEKKYHMGLSYDTIKEIKEFDSRARKKKCLEEHKIELEKEKEMIRRKKLKKLKKKGRKKLKRNSATKIKRWWVKIIENHHELFKRNIFNLAYMTAFKDSRHAHSTQGKKFNYNDWIHYPKFENMVNRRKKLD